MKTIDQLYKDYSTLIDNVVITYLKAVRGKKIDQNYFEKHNIEPFSDTKGNIIISITEDTIYTEEGEYSIYDADIIDLLYFIEETQIN